MFYRVLETHGTAMFEWSPRMTLFVVSLVAEFSDEVDEGWKLGLIQGNAQNLGNKSIK